MTKWKTVDMDTFAGEYITFIFCLLISHQTFVIAMQPLTLNITYFGIKRSLFNNL